MAEQVAKFRFSEYQILKSSIAISDISTIDEDIEIEITHTSGVNDEYNKFKLTLDLSITDKSGSLAINVIADGFFEFDSDLSESEKISFFNVNAPAILFPYVRAYVTALTALSGVPPVVMPTINLAARDRE